MFPSKNEKMFYEYKFMTNGTVQIGKKFITEWLQNRSKNTKIDKKKMYILLNELSKQMDNGLIIDYMYTNLLARDPYKHQAFIKV